MGVITPIEHYIITHSETKPSIQLIEGLVCKEFNITKAELRHKTRKGVIPTARFMCWCLIRKRKVLSSLQEIAKEYDLIQHASIIHGIKTIKGRMMWEKDLKNKYLNVLKSL